MALFTLQPTKSPQTGLLTKNNLGAKPQSSAGPSQSTLSAGSFSTPNVSDAQRASNFKAKYGFDMPGYTPVGVKAASVNDNIQPQDKTLSDKFVSNSSTPGGRAQISSAQNPIPPVPPTPPTPPVTGTPPPTYGGIIGQLVQKAQGPSDAYTQAYQNAQDYNRQLQQSLSNEAQALAQNAQPAGGYGRSIEYQQGAGNVLQNLYGQQQQAIGAGFQGASNLLGAANTQQQLQQQGLGMAAGFAAPQAYAQTQIPFSPVSGQYGTPAGSAYGPGGIASVGALGTQIQQGGAVQQMSGQQSQAQALGTNLSSLIDSAGINPANASVFTSFLNGVNQWINTQSGDPKYQNFANLINEISSRYASILNQSGGTPTDQSTISHSIINGLASGQDIKTVLATLDKNATDSINALAGTAGRNVISGGQGGSVSAGGYSFVQDANGNWVAK